MDLINWVQTGGLPVKGERLQEMQTAYTSLQELGNLAGNFTILSGCVVAGTSVSDGCVFINGEVLKFKSGFIAADVVIIQNESAKEFENGEVKTMHYERYATFGTNPDNSWPWESFERPDPIIVLMARMAVLEKKTAIFQAGAVVFPWFLPIAQIPAGFQVVTTMAGKTIFGFDANQTEFDAIGKTGGFKAKTLSIAEMPAHTHDIKTSSGGGGFTAPQRTNGTENSSVTESKGSGQSFSILNPYTTAVYIEYIG